MEVVQQVFGVVLVFGLLGLAVWKLRRGGVASGSILNIAPWNKTRGARSLETLERVALTAQHAVHLVRVNGRELVVVTHPQGCSFLLQQDAEKSA